MATESKKITFVFLRLNNPSRERANGGCKLIKETGIDCKIKRKL